jgi:hypothetical protein
MNGPDKVTKISFQRDRDAGQTWAASPKRNSDILSGKLAFTWQAVKICPREWQIREITMNKTIRMLTAPV